MIQISSNASQKLEEIRKEEGKSSQAFLRIYVKKGGCSGLSYKLGFEENLKEGDKQFESKKQKVVVDAQSYLYLIGLTLDYSGGLNGRGFVFSNPNANKSCGCGSSFNI